MTNPPNSCNYIGYGHDGPEYAKGKPPCGCKKLGDGCPNVRSVYLVTRVADNRVRKTNCIILAIVVLFIWKYWAIILAVLAVLSLLYLGFVGYRVHRDRIAAQRAAERRLIRHADEENWLVGKGDMAGVWGEFPPPPAMRGVGIKGVSCR